MLFGNLCIVKFFLLVGTIIRDFTSDRGLSRYLDNSRNNIWLIIAVKGLR